MTRWRCGRWTNSSPSWPTTTRSWCRDRSSGRSLRRWISIFARSEDGSIDATTQSSGVGSVMCAACISILLSRPLPCRFMKDRDPSQRMHRQRPTRPTRTCATPRIRIQASWHREVGRCIGRRLWPGARTRSHATTRTSFAHSWRPSKRPSIPAEDPRDPRQRLITHLETHHCVARCTFAWEAHFTPKRASWVNQVELFFSILQREVIRNGSFPSQQDLITKMMKFITEYDQTAEPFRWTYAADPLKAA